MLPHLHNYSNDDRIILNPFKILFNDLSLDNIIKIKFDDNKKIIIDYNLNKCDLIAVSVTDKLKDFFTNDTIINTEISQYDNHGNCKYTKYLSDVKILNISNSQEDADYEQINLCIEYKDMKDTSLIPIGMYCYHFDHLYDGPKLESYAIPIVSCPYDSYREINGVTLPYCEYLEKLGWQNGLKDGEFEKLVEYYGSEDAVFENLRLDLLWDGCKECGENYRDDIDLDTEEGREKYDKKVEDWIIKVKKLKNEIKN